jgi:hypothetical protein
MFVKMDKVFDKERLLKWTRYLIKKVFKKWSRYLIIHADVNQSETSNLS